jgi:hypothetical protein
MLTVGCPVHVSVSVAGEVPPLYASMLSRCRPVASVTDALVRFCPLKLTLLVVKR